MKSIHGNRVVSKDGNIFFKLPIIQGLQKHKLLKDKERPHLLAREIAINLLISFFGTGADYKCLA